MSSVYGRQPYHPQRITSKAPYLHYQSPINPRTAAVTAGLMGSGTKVSQRAPGVTSSPVDAAREEFKKTHAIKKPGDRFYFHPAVDLSQVYPGEGKSASVLPVEGQLVPMAVPLGRPKTDPRLRLPITTATAGATSGDALTHVVFSSVLIG